MEGCGEVGRYGKVRTGKWREGWKAGSGRAGKGEGGLDLDVCSGPASYATIGPNGVSIDSSGQNRGQK